MKDDDIEYGDVDLLSLIGRYEEMLKKQQLCYFDVEDFESIVDYYLSDNAISEASSAIDAAVYFHPTSLELKFKKVEVEIEKRNVPYVKQQLEQLEPFATSQSTSTYHILKVKLSLLIGDVDKAVQLMDSLLDEGVDKQDIHSVVGDFISAAEYANAVRYIQYVIDDTQAYSHLLLDLAYCYEELEQIPAAITAYKQYLDENPFSFLAWYELSRLCRQSKLLNEALEAIDFAITVDHKSIQALGCKADLLIEIEQYSTAVNVLHEMLELEPQKVQIVYLLGECYEQLDRLDEALVQYRLVVTYDDKFSEAYYGMASVLKKLGQSDESVRYIRKAISLKPADTEYRFEYARLLVERGEISDAAEELEYVVSADGNDLEAWLLLADLYLLTDPQKAISTLERATTFLYSLAELRYRIAVLYYVLKDMEKCVEHFEQGLMLDVKQAEKFFTLCPNARHNEQIITLFLNAKTKENLYDF